MSTPRHIPPYIQIPISATPIDPPSSSPGPSKRPNPSVPPPPPASFPPTASGQGRKFSITAPGSGPLPLLSTNVSDLLLSSLLPANLPKIPRKDNEEPGRLRELSTQRETLSVPLLSNNFRRFVTKVGPVFWVQDRVEEILFWRKPMWTCAYMLTWTFISFRPRLLLLLPFLTLILIILHRQERINPLPSLLGVNLPVPSSTNTDSDAYDPEERPESGGGDSVPPREVESAVDYYMNIQAIQNLMGLVSDVFDYTNPRISTLLNPSPSPSPTAFTITSTHLLLLLIPPSLFLPLLPPWTIPYLLLPLGLAPPLAFHPTLTPLLLSLPRHSGVLQLRARLENLLAMDRLADSMAGKEISVVEVWENERLDPALSSKPISAAVVPVWGSKFLRSGERAPWVKVFGQGSKWKPIGGGDDAGGLALIEPWEWLEGEEWRVDVCGLWSTVGTNEDGWAYTDDSWQNPSTLPIMDLDSPGGPMRKLTRRRKWSRRVFRAQVGKA